jgi:hypothetical protein
MVSITNRNGTLSNQGLLLLRQMILARAFPELSPVDRLAHVTEAFDSLESLDQLCVLTGGHVRDLLRLLSDWIGKSRQFPLSREILDTVICVNRDDMMMNISNEEWTLLRQVSQCHRVGGDPTYQTLIRRRLIFEYHDNQGAWFDVNSLLVGVPELQ